MTTITPYAGARYQKGHGLANIFRTLFRTAIPLLKGPAVRAGIGLAGDVIRGKSMTQALKNRVAPFIGDVMKTAGAERSPSGRGRKTQKPAKRRASAGRPVSTKKKKRRHHSNHGDIFSSK